MLEPAQAERGHGCVSSKKIGFSMAALLLASRPFSPLLSLCASEGGESGSEATKGRLECGSSVYINTEERRR